MPFLRLRSLAPRASALLAPRSLSRGFASQSAVAADAADVKVPAAMVKELRERTGAGLMDCRNALREGALDMDSAIEIRE